MHRIFEDMFEEVALLERWGLDHKGKGKVVLMKAYRTVYIQLILFLTSALDGRGWSASHLGCTASEKTAPHYPLNSRLGNRWALSLNGHCAEKKHPVSLPGIIFQFFGCPACTLYTKLIDLSKLLEREWHCTLSHGSSKNVVNYNKSNTLHKNVSTFNLNHISNHAFGHATSIREKFFFIAYILVWTKWLDSKSSMYIMYKNITI